MTLNYILLITTMVYVIIESIGFGFLTKSKKTINYYYNAVGLIAILMYNFIIIHIFNLQFVFSEYMLFGMAFLFIRFGIFDYGYNTIIREHNQKINDVLYSSKLINNILSTSEEKHGMYSVYFNVFKFFIFCVGMAIFVELF